MSNEAALKEKLRKADEKIASLEKQLAYANESHSILCDIGIEHGEVMPEKRHCLQERIRKLIADKEALLADVTKQLREIDDPLAAKHLGPLGTKTVGVFPLIEEEKYADQKLQQ
jgi:hypothetical protein